MSVVYALATPPAKSAICVFRVSGEGCLDALDGLFKKKPKEHGFFCVRDMYLNNEIIDSVGLICLLYTSPSPRDLSTSRMPSSA